jgi:hypothetical protein
VFDSAVTDRAYDESGSSKEDILKIIFRGTVVQREKVEGGGISGEESIPVSIRIDSSYTGIILVESIPVSIPQE